LLKTKKLRKNMNKNNVPVTVQAVAVEPAPYSQQQAVYAQTHTIPQRQGRPLETNELGVCRKCGLAFQRPAGMNDGHARYYRCEKCNGERWMDILSSCAIS
jgi:predicted Zn-ribbon and HTH transcriptional regulator